jgi:hypothetical protein
MADRNFYSNYSNFNTYGQPGSQPNGDPQTGLVPNQESPYIESVSATTSPDNTNSGNSAYLIAIAAVIIVSLLIGALVGLGQSLLSYAEKNYSTQELQEQLIPYSNSELESYLEDNTIQS